MPEPARDVLAALHSIAARFDAMLRAVPGVSALPAPALPAGAAELMWDNRIYAAPRFRRAHLEVFAIPGRFTVVHLCVMPQLDSPSPIFGFDILAGPAQVTGLFLDFSPVHAASGGLCVADIVNAAPRGRYGAARPLPEWGSVFSPAMLAVRPGTADELTAGLDAAANSLEFYLARVGKTPCAELPPGVIAAGQTAYAMAQRRNQHTARMLARHVGEAAARHFIDTVLFPTPGPQDAPRAWGHAA